VDNARWVRVVEKGLGIEVPEDPEWRRVFAVGMSVAVLAVAFRLFFWGYTGRVWEDALTATVHSENCARGLGLSHFHPDGPPVQGFSSPLGVLIPLMADLIHVGWGLWWIRIVSAFAGGLTVIYVTALCVHPKVRLPLPLALMAAIYVAIEHHQVLWGMAGMETQIAVCVAMASLYYLIAGKDLRLAICLALCMYARPDFVFWAVVAGAAVLWRSWRRFWVVAGVALAIYLPWLVFTTVYYGSFVPNTIVAKSLGYRLWWQSPDLTFGEAWSTIWGRIGGRYLSGSIFQPLGPCFDGHGTHFSHVIHEKGRICQILIVLGLFGAIDVVVKRQWALVPLIGFVAAYTLYYVFGVALVFGWYVMPLMAVMIVLCARGAQALTNIAPKPRLRAMESWALSLVFLAVHAAILPETMEAERRIQRDIEEQARRPAAMYLGSVMGPTETVGCEPLGYVSYFTRRAVYDWPGLASRRVVEYSRAHPDKRTLLDMLDALRPDYLLLRPFEYEEAQKRGMGWIDEDYAVVQRFEATAERTQGILLLNRNIDTSFVAFKKR